MQYFLSRISIIFHIIDFNKINSILTILTQFHITAERFLFKTFICRSRWAVLPYDKLAFWLVWSWVNQTALFE